MKKDTKLKQVTLKKVQVYPITTIVTWIEASKAQLGNICKLGKELGSHDLTDNVDNIDLKKNVATENKRDNSDWEIVAVFDTVQLFKDIAGTPSIWDVAVNKMRGNK